MHLIRSRLSTKVHPESILRVSVSGHRSKRKKFPASATMKERFKEQKYVHANYVHTFWIEILFGIKPVTVFPLKYGPN
jgi:hypothetical protein